MSEVAVVDDSVSKALKIRPIGVRQQSHSSDKKLIAEAQISGIFFPWNKRYKIWWIGTCMAAIFTFYFETYEIAFSKNAGTFDTVGSSTLESILLVIFGADLLISFNLAYYENEVMIYQRKTIVEHYFKRMFWIDLIGVIPFETIASSIATDDLESEQALLWSLLRLLRLVRLHRLAKFQDFLQYNPRVSFMKFTICRNMAAALSASHFWACAIYFLARLRDFDDTTWFGPLVRDYSGFSRFIVSLYWGVLTFSTVGYGDYTPSNTEEQILGIIAMFVNLVIAAWIIGSMTLLIVKNDEMTGEYRDALQTLTNYSKMHGFDKAFQKKLEEQLRLEFNNREISDEKVLANFPSSVRRRILRKLYIKYLWKTELMNDVRQQFVDAFLNNCRVEIFSPGEEIVERGSISSDLFLLVGGMATVEDELVESDSTLSSEDPPIVSRRNLWQRSKTEDSSVSRRKLLQSRTIEAGEFIGEVGFFTESPQVDTVVCVTVCKTLSMSRSMYKMLAQDHPGSVGKILRHLLNKVKAMALELNLPRNLSILRAGSVFDYSFRSGTKVNMSPSNRQAALTAVEDLVKMHMEKQRDDQTTRLLFAASRGDTATIELMCDQGFDANNADYDNRTALMVAAMKGNTDVAKLLLDKYNANPNLTDIHNSTALMEAVKNARDDTMELLLQHDAKLCMKDSLAASMLCQTVMDGDILFLRRMLQANINVNAADYDKRTAAHIAAAEGNVAALRVLVEFGADLKRKDRWENKLYDEAVRANAGKMLEYLKALKETPSTATDSIHDLVKMYSEKQKDDKTTRLLFAAWRDDTATVEALCDEGFDANNADYDNRTALMIASMKGNTAVVELLLEKYNADPNLCDVHGSTALMEAVKNAHEDTMEILMKNGAKLLIKESLAASMLCETVMEGDILFLKRLLKAGINVNTVDYDKRTAGHIAAAEGNIAALKVLIDAGADLSLKDRWNNSLNDEALRANAGMMINYLKSLEESCQATSND